MLTHVAAAEEENKFHGSIFITVNCYALEARNRTLKENVYIPYAYKV